MQTSLLFCKLNGPGLGSRHCQVCVYLGTRLHKPVPAHSAGKQATPRSGINGTVYVASSIAEQSFHPGPFQLPCALLSHILQASRQPLTPRVPSLPCPATARPHHFLQVFLCRSGQLGRSTSRYIHPRPIASSPRCPGGLADCLRRSGKAALVSELYRAIFFSGNCNTDQPQLGSV